MTNFFSKFVGLCFRDGEVVRLHPGVYKCYDGAAGLLMHVLGTLPYRIGSLQWFNFEEDWNGAKRPGLVSKGEEDDGEYITVNMRHLKAWVVKNYSRFTNPQTQDEIMKRYYEERSTLEFQYPDLGSRAIMLMDLRTRPGGLLHHDGDGYGEKEPVLKPVAGWIMRIQSATAQTVSVSLVIPSKQKGRYGAAEGEKGDQFQIPIELITGKKFRIPVPVEAKKCFYC